MTALIFGYWESLGTMFNNHLFDNQLSKTCLAAVLALGLAACSGSGSDSGPSQAELDAAKARAAAAEQAQQDAETNLNAAIAAAEAARKSVANLSNASSDAEVMAAQTKVTVARQAVAKLQEDHSLHESVAKIEMDLEGVQMERTVASELAAVNDALSTASMAVDDLDRAASTADEVADARMKVNAAQKALNSATALSAEQRVELDAKIDGVDDTLDGIEAYRATDAGQLAVAEAAVDVAEELIDALTHESTPKQAGDAYAALQRAKQALAAAEDLPDNVKTRLSARIKELEDQASGQSSITDKLAMAAMAVADLNAESTAEDVADARTKVNAAKEAVMGLEDDDARKTAIASLDMDLIDIEEERKRIAARPGLDEKAEALVAAIGKRGMDDMNPLRAANPSMTTDVDGTATNDIDDKGKATTASKLMMSSMSIHSIDDWMGNTYSKMTPAKVKTPTAAAMPRMDDTVVVYNNKGADEKVGYANYFGGMDDRTVTAGTGALLVVTDDDTNVITDMVALQGTASVISLTASGDGSSSVKGTFHGLSGTFSCDAACTISRLSDGKYQTAGTLTFMPTLKTGEGVPASATQVADLEIMIEDRDYMHFGYWKNASMKDGKPVYMVNAFSGGTMASTTTETTDSVQSIEGSAKYAGPASGQYVRKEVDSSANPTDLYHGQFTADANLTAYFGGDTVAVTKQGTIEGTIDNFMDGDTAIDPTWSVTLKMAGFADATSGVTATETQTASIRTTSSPETPRVTWG